MIDLSAAPFMLGELAGAALAAISARLVWPHRTQPGAKALAVTLWICAWWSFWHALSLAAATLPLKTALAPVWGTGAVAVDTTVLLFALEYRRQAKLPRPVVVLAWLPTLAIVATIWTNNWLHLYWSRASLVPGPPFTRIGVTLGPSGLAHALWANVAIVTASAMLLRVCFEQRGLYRRQMAFMLAGIAVPSAWYLVFVTGHSPIQAYDLTTLSLAVGVSLMGWAIYGQKMLEVMPIAHATVMDSIGDAVLVVDAAERIVYTNHALREIAGEAGLEGQRLDQAWPELAGILAASQGRGQVARLVAGQERTFDVLVSDLLGRGATAHGQALILRDDTDRRLVGQLQESREQIIGELRRANTQLTKLDELKSDLISNVAHELRAPLSSIRAFAELLMDAELDEVTRSEFTRIVHEESERLTRLVTSVLDMSRIDSGSIEWRPQPVDLGKALGDCVIAFQPAADAKGLELRLDLQAGVPAAQVDPDGLRQVVTNLISNAIKFTDHGEVLVRAEERDGEVTISVRDTGRGIPEEERQQIFERFYQVGDVLASKPQGSGLGLAIVSEILKQHGTDIELESASGAGSRFSFSLPAAGVLAR